MKYIPVYDSEIVRQKVFEINRNSEFDFINIDKTDVRMIAWAKRYLKDKNLRPVLRKIGKKQYQANLRRGAYRKKERLKVKARAVADKILNLHESFRYSYETLMERYGNTVIWATKYMKHDRATQRKLREIKRIALITSLGKVSERDGDITVSSLSRTNPGLEKAAREVYTIEDRESACYQLLKDAGLTYPIEYFRRNIKWSYGKLMNAVLDIGSDPLLFKEEAISHAIWLAAKNRLKRPGKIMMLAGIDYLQKKRLDKPKFTFTKKDLSSVLRDITLSPDERITAVYNALALQYYSFEEYSSRVSREPTNSCDIFVDMLEQARVLHDRVRIYLGSSERRDNEHIVGLELDDNIHNRFSSLRVSEFCFEGENSEKDSRDFYSSLEDKCRGLFIPHFGTRQ